MAFSRSENHWVTSTGAGLAGTPCPAAGDHAGVFFVHIIKM
jgi:hypothetical protein